MSLHATENDKPSLNKGDEDIEIPSIRTPRQPKILRKASTPDSFEDEHDGVDDRRGPQNNVGSPLSQQSPIASPGGGGSAYDDTTAGPYATQEREDEAFVQKFWTAYDEILILSLFTQVGILARLGAAIFFRYFDNVFHSDSALFTNLPLNSLSCFVMGLLCSGEGLMQIIHTRFTPPRLQYDLHREAVQELAGEEDQMSIFSSEEINGEEMTSGSKRGWRRRRRRRLKREQQSPMNRSSSLFRRQQIAQSPEIFDELREVQLLAWERRIRASVCLLLFPVKKEDVDIVENYFDEGYRRDQEDSNDIASASNPTFNEHGATPRSNGQAEMGGFDDLVFEEEIDEGPRTPGIQMKNLSSPRTVSPLKSPAVQTPSNDRDENSDAYNEQGLPHARGNVHISSRQYGQLEGGNVIDHGDQDSPHLDQIISNMANDVSNKISFMRRVNIANGWDVGTSPQEKSEDLTLGLRDGLCGALSSFSSWISSMVNLFRAGQIGQAFVGLTLGIQLPLVAYRFGQHVAVYVFVWRCRREKRQDERRGYGIQLHTDEDIPTGFIRSTDPHHRSSFDSAEASPAGNSQTMNRTKGRRTVHDEENDVPSIRAIFTALFIFCLVAQLTSLNFYKKTEDRLLALSLLFSPLGVLTRWRMMKFNAWRPSFPIGTFLCNVTACALAGTLGTLLAGNPGDQERIALKSIIAGFGGTLSSVARFIVEILALIDPILFRLDGFYYAIISVGTGLLVSFLFAASVDWADVTVDETVVEPSTLSNRTLFE